MRAARRERVRIHFASLSLKFDLRNRRAFRGVKDVQPKLLCFDRLEFLLEAAADFLAGENGLPLRAPSRYWNSNFCTRSPYSLLDANALNHVAACQDRRRSRPASCRCPWPSACVNRRQRPACGPYSASCFWYTLEAVALTSGVRLTAGMSIAEPSSSSLMMVSIGSMRGDAARVICRLDRLADTRPCPRQTEADLILRGQRRKRHADFASVSTWR